MKFEASCYNQTITEIRNLKRIEKLVSSEIPKLIFNIFYIVYDNPLIIIHKQFRKKNSPSYRLFIFGAPLCIICRIMQRRLCAAYFSSHTENHEQFCLLITLYKTENILARKLWYKYVCLLYTSPSPRDQRGSRMPSSA